MTDPVTIAQIVAGPAGRFANWITFESRVARAASRAMRRRGIRIDIKSLRMLSYQPDFDRRLANPTKAERDRLLDELSSVLLEPASGNQSEADVLFDVLVVAYRKRLRGSTPSSEFKEQRDDARDTRLIGAVEDFSSDDALFETRVSLMPPLRADEFRVARSRWPRIATVLGVLVTAEDRLTMLTRWSAASSSFLADAPPVVFGLLADVAADSPSAPSSRALSELYVNRALDAGIEPRGYWLMRLVTPESASNREELTSLVAEARGYPLVDVALNLAGNESSISELEGWKPGSPREEHHRRLLLIELYSRVLKLDDSIDLARDTFAEFDSTAAAIAGARGLIVRSSLDSTIAHKNDLPDALSLSIAARQRRRSWGVEAGDALAVELRVRRMLSDSEGAFGLANGGGDFPATPAELRHPEVMAEVARMQAEMGDLDVARRLLFDVQESQRPQIRALIAEREGDSEAAASAWSEAIDASTDFGDKAHFALQLAFHGIRSPFVDELIAENRGIADELGLVADLFAGTPGALEKFRGFANTNHRGAMFLLIYLGSKKEWSAASQVAREGARKWGDPDLWLESARHLMRENEYDDVISDIHAALAAAPKGWGGKRTAYRLLVEAFSSSGDWQKARTAAAQLIADEPDNPSAAWALITCHLRLNDPSSALQTWQASGALQPHGEMQVRSWIELLGEFGDAVGSAEDALKIAELYPNDEPIRSALLSVLFLNHRSGQQQPTDPELDDDEEDSIPNPERDAFRTLLADYIRDFPDGSIRQVAVDLENPLESIKAAIGDRPDTSEIDATVAKGGLPVGFAAAIHGRNYLETLLTREFGPVYAATRDVDAEASAIALAHEKGAVLDTSALVTLAYLPDEVRVLVGGHLPNLRVVVEQHRDARIGLRSAARNSGLSIIPSPAGGRPSIDHRSPEELANRRVLAEAIEASFARFSSVSNPKVSALTELADFDRPFLLAADLAFATNVPLWADDQALKDIANASGALSFGTPEFLRHLREEGRVNSDLIDLAEASLVAHGYGGIRFTSNVWQLATSLGRSPSSLMNAIRIAATDDLVARIKFAQSQIDINVDQPQDLTGFVHALAQWLEKIAPSEEVAIQNLEVLARQLLGKPWMTSSTLPYCVAAFRAIDGRVDGARVLLHQIFRMFEALAQQVDDRTAAEVVFGLVSRLDPEDGMRVRSAIFSRRFE